MSFGFQIAEPEPEPSAEALSQYKKDFAYALLRNPNDCFKAAQAVFPTNRVMALKASNQWPNDPVVITHKKELLEQLGEESFLPTKADFLTRVWDTMGLPTTPPADAAKLADIYAKARGFFPKADAQAAVVNVTNKVMVVRAYNDEAEWETKLARQQEALLCEVNDITDEN